MNAQIKHYIKDTSTLLYFMAPFYGWGSTASRLEPLRGGSLLFTTKFPEVPGTHFIDLGRMIPKKSHPKETLSYPGIKETQDRDRKKYIMDAKCLESKHFSLPQNLSSIGN